MIESADMINPSGRIENLPRVPGKTPLGLRLQTWLAAAFLLCPWGVTFFLYRPFLQYQPAIILALLPGFAVSIYLQCQLLRHVGTNHRPGEEDQPFPTLGAATWITLLRAAAVVALAGFLPLASQQRGHALPPALIWVPGLLYLGISLADLLDGFVARKQHRETELGKRLDIETDAAGLLVAIVVAVSLHRLPALTLLVGLAYYPFIFGIWWRQRRHLPVVTLQSRPYARIIAGFQMGLVGLALLPLFQPAFVCIAALLVMTPLLAGFVRDWLVASCQLQTDGSQQTAVDRWAGLVLTQSLPLGLRLMTLAGWGTVLVRGDLSPAHPLWQGAVTICCLLVGVGCMGRTAALILSLLLGCSSSPFGASVSALFFFAAAIVLMLTGPGPWALWAPEEPILYRRHRKGSAV